MRWNEILTEARLINLAQLAQMRDEFIENPGTDPDYEAILELLDIPDESEEEIHAAFFDAMMAQFVAISQSGAVRVYRCISVRDPKKFIASIGKRSLGYSWSYDEESASCEYHPEMNHEHVIMLVADAPVASIDWEQTMVQNFGHVDEHEICVAGPVNNLQVILDGQVIHQAANAK
jgi:hypothetical protein